MKKFVSFLFLLVLALSTTSFSQGWSFKSFFPDTLHQGNTGGQALAVSKDGKVWFGYYGTSDSVLSAPGVYSKVREIFVYNADGTPASFNPITIIAGGYTDTLYNSTRGACTDINGNIIWSSYNHVDRINYQTGAGMNQAIYSGGTLTACAVDFAGDVFVAPVIPKNPIQVWGTDFTNNGNAVDSSIGYSRTLAVSLDGNTIYWPGYSNNAVYVYNRTDAFSPFVLKDTVLRGFSCESMAWDPKTGYLWASSGSGDLNNPPNQDTTVKTYYTAPTWYAVDVQNWTIKDSINWKYFHSDDVVRPRGMAFSPDGGTAYVTCFGGSNYPVVEAFTRPATGVKNEGSNVVTSFKMSQNYPNPFNPSTEISYSVAKSGFVSLKVYDMLGRLVSTLVNENKSTGNYTVRFDATRYASGTYIYQMNAGGLLITKKMVFLK